MTRIIIMIFIAICLFVFLGFLIDNDVNEFITGSVAVFSGLFVLFVLFVCTLYTLNTITKNTDIAVIQQKYNALVYKLESEKARDDFGLLNKEIVDEVQDFNEKKARSKAITNAPIIGFAFYDCYENVEFIEYK